jgi:hypothetical protein
LKRPYSLLGHPTPQEVKLPANPKKADVVSFLISVWC